MTISVQPEWASKLAIQQQSVLFLATRGADGIPKTHPSKDVQRAYRGTVLVAAERGRCLNFGEHGDSFMSLALFSTRYWVDTVIPNYFNNVDSLPHHFHMHLTHGAQILGYKHPDPLFRVRWWEFYIASCLDMHVNHETEEQMDARLSDWGKFKERMGS